MNIAAIGMRVHSGWGALVAVTGDVPEIEVLDRRRIVIKDADSPGAKQPYHFAKQLEPSKAEEYLRDCAAVSEELALAAVRDVVVELHNRDYRVMAAAVLLASGHPLPALTEILASHPAMHTAEGEFFRKAVWRACERLNLPVTGLRERDLDEELQRVFGRVAPDLQRRVAGLRKSLCSPWTADEKKACLAAAMVLKNDKRPS